MATDIDDTDDVDNEGAPPQQDAVPLGQHEFELTPREEAIARGEDPDTVDASANTGSAGESAESEVSDQSSERIPETGSEANEGSTAKGKDAPAAWYTDEDAELAEAYALSREDLAEFGSRDEFSRSIKHIDRLGLLNLKAQMEAAGANQEPAKGEKKSGENTSSDNLSEPPTGKIDRQKFVDKGYGAEELALIDAYNAQFEKSQQLEAKLADHEQKLSAWQEQQEEIAKASEINEFHDIVDTFEEDLFGRSVKDGRAVQLDSEHDQARQLLFNATSIVRQMFENAVKASGGKQKMPAPRVILQRAKHLAFGELLVKQEKAAHERRISEQSRRRRPAAARPDRPSGGGKSAARVSATQSDEDRVQSLVNDKDIAAAWERMNEENN